jgi:hypothetical protein
LLTALISVVAVQAQSEATPHSERNSPKIGAAGTTIAYVRRSTEIRAISPDGSGDRRLWTHPDLTEDIGIFELAWRPDGSELAFSSGHAAVSSFYHADIYTIKPDWSGLRKLTNPPDRSEFAKFPKGAVTITVRNDQPGDVSPNSFIVYVVGADEPQQINVPAGTARTLVFKSVADFGKHVQPVVAMFGKYRWYVPGPDVVAGRNVSATLTISDQGFELFGAFRPVWRSDGSRISYRSGLCVLSSVSANPTPGEYSFNPLFGGKNPLGTCAWDWGPTPSTANQILYSENGSSDSSIYQIAEGGTHPGKKLATYSDIAYQILSDLHWLPDASGFLYSTVNLMRDSANIFRYDFASHRTVQLTKLQNSFAGAFSISPDGKFVAFERCKAYDDDKNCDIWIAGTDGSSPHLLVANGQRPAWGK